MHTAADTVPLLGCCCCWWCCCCSHCAGRRCCRYTRSPLPASVITQCCMLSIAGRRLCPWSKRRPPRLASTHRLDLDSAVAVATCLHRVVDAVTPPPRAPAGARHPTDERVRRIRASKIDEHLPSRARTNHSTQLPQQTGRVLTNVSGRLPGWVGLS